MSDLPNDSGRLPPIEIMILSGVQQSLAQALSFPQERIVFLASSDRMRIADRLAKLEGGPASVITWPRIFLHLSQVSSGTEEPLHGYNPKSLARHGRYLKTSFEQTKVTKANFIATIFEFEVVFMTDSFNAAFAYTNSWMAAALHNRANFSLTYAGSGFDIRTIMSSTISTPDREESVEQPNVFEYTGTIKVVGYSSDPHEDGQSEIQLLRKPVVNVQLSGSLKLPEDPAVFSFDRKMPIKDGNG